MSVGFRVRGTYRRNLLGRPSGKDVLRQAADIWRELEPDLVMLEFDGHRDTTLWMQAHPAVEPLEMTAPAAGVIEVAGNTSTGGPGYHRRMIDDIRTIGERLGITWVPSDDDELFDETGYFEGGDRERVDTTMLTWLQVVLGAVRDSEAGTHVLALPIGHRASTADDDRVITAMGPRDAAWVARGASEPTAAIDFFSWWGDDRDAAHYRDRAFARMWVDVHWTTPVDDERRRDLADVDRELQHALRLDDAIDLPWREWLEIRGLLGGPKRVPNELDRRIAERAAQVDPATRLIGFRRGSAPVTIDPGWTITIPASLVETTDGDAWVAYDTVRSVRLSPMTVAAKDGGGDAPSADELASIAPSGRAAIQPGDEALRGAAEIADVVEEGRSFRALQGVLTARGEILILTIVFGDDEAWAVETYRSIRFNPL